MSVIWAGLACFGIAIGCAQEDPAAPPDRGTFDQRVERLEDGAAIAAVKEELGEPVSEFIDENGDGALNYEKWRIGFSGGEMDYRTRRIRHMPQEAQGGDTIDAEVRSLQVGTPLSEVTATLGVPEVVEIEEPRAGPVERVLRYGSWEIRFRHGLLRTRTRW